MAISELANQLVGQSKEDAYNKASFARQQQMDSLNTLLQTLHYLVIIERADSNQLMSLANLLGGRSDKLYNRYFGENSIKIMRGY